MPVSSKFDSKYAARGNAASKNGTAGSTNRSVIENSEMRFRQRRRRDAEEALALGGMSMDFRTRVVPAYVLGRLAELEGRNG